MRATTLLLSTVLALSGTAAFAQSSYNIVVEPVGQSIDSIINAPIEYDDNGVVKAQHFNADDLTDEEYQALLDEADRIRAYRDANGLNFEEQYIYPEAVETSVVEAAPSYQIELFAPEATPSIASSVSTSAKIHTVSKGDTLYNISKRYDTTVTAIQAENGISTTELSIGQQIRIPGVIVESINSVSRPIYASAPASETVYAVLPKDTLYSISRRTCVGVKDIISRNAIANPNALTPGQRITLPVGHCLSR